LQVAYKFKKKLNPERGPSTPQKWEYTSCGAHTLEREQYGNSLVIQCFVIDQRDGVTLPMATRQLQQQAAAVTTEISVQCHC